MVRVLLSRLLDPESWVPAPPPPPFEPTAQDHRLADWVAYYDMTAIKVDEHTAAAVPGEPLGVC